MSLAPHERRALASIEDSLGGSDPRLATMLATFTLPSLRSELSGGKRLIRRMARAKCLLLVGLAIVAVCAIVMYALLRTSDGGAASCGQVNWPAAVGAQTLSCPPASPSTHYSYPADRWHPEPGSRDVQSSQ
jgi:hypothetical protein